MIQVEILQGGCGKEEWGGGVEECMRGGKVQGYGYQEQGVAEQDVPG